MNDKPACLEVLESHIPSRLLPQDGCGGCQMMNDVGLKSNFCEVSDDGGRKSWTD